MQFRTSVTITNGIQIITSDYDQPMRKHIVISSLFTITLTACGSSSSSTSETSILADEEETMDATASTVVAPTDAVVNADGSVSINVIVGTDDYETLAGERVVKIALGSAVTITLTDPNEDQDYHLHVYDLGAEAKKGEPGVISLVVDQAGQFDVESHTTGQMLLVLVVG
jgi:ABC-type Fe3+-hydroxamate transport system substrate-binding protein